MNARPAEMPVERPSDLDSLSEDIAQAKARLIALDAERETVRQRLEQLEKTRAVCRSANPLRVIAPANGPQTSEAKLGLFRSLFKGREDVFPKRWDNPKTERSGYSPACKNEWVRGVCDKPRVKCGECPNQAFIPVTDQVLLDHLQGRHIMGVYPLLENETCWFLAVDFDDGDWAADVCAFMDTCRRLNLPAAVERSRSGSGAHVWFFFSAPVPAVSARKLGCHVITETMARRHELKMESYDRLFPSQDTMPRGGFGNLIALPLQHGPRQEGNSVFLDENLNPYADDLQCAYLASVPRIAPTVVEAIASEAGRRGTVVGVRMAELAEDNDSPPWVRLPSGKSRPTPITDPLPKSITIVLAQRLFVPKADLPPALLNQIKRLAAFQNPEFYKKQSMRLPVTMTPRVIACAEDLKEYVALPRGCRTDLDDLLRGHGVSIGIDDQRNGGEPLDLTFQGKLTPLQERATQALLGHDTGVFVAPPGIGKTVVGTYLVAARSCSTLILVHRRPLIDQWQAQLSLFLGIESKDIGQIGNGKRAPNGRLDVAMIQSLVRQGTVEDLVAQYGQVIVDECHHLPAVSFERVLSEVKARYFVGLTATPQRRDGHHPITEMQLGPVRFTVDRKSHAAERPLDCHLIVRETRFRLPKPDQKPSIQEVYATHANNDERNELILNDVITSLEEGRSPILLTERKDHLEFFATRLRRLAKNLIVLQGGMGAKAERAVKEQLASIPPNEERLVLATGRYIGEGFDDARLDTLFLAMPVSWKGTLVQYTGRLHRLRPGKTEVRIFDYVDRDVPMLLRMFEKRLRGYRAIGYARGEAPLGYEEPNDERVIEYDDNARFEHDIELL